MDTGTGLCTSPPVTAKTIIGWAERTIWEFFLRWTITGALLRKLVCQISLENSFDANREIVQLLKERGMLLDAQNFHHSYPYCWRSKTPIIFRNVEQFFIRIDALRDKAQSIRSEVDSVGAKTARRRSNRVLTG
jgi:isoleucyl-tRNA synthetase